MKFMKPALLIFSLLFALHTAAAADEPLKLLSRDKRIQISLPHETWENYPVSTAAAQLEAVSAANHAYLIVVSEPKEDFESLAGYTKIVSEAMQKKVENPVMGEATPITVGGKPATRFELSGIAKGIKIAYVVSVVETATRFNQVIGWSLKSLAEKNKLLLQDIANDVEELPEPPVTAVSATAHAEPSAKAPK